MRLVSEEYPLPETRKGIEVLVGQILAQDGEVHRIVVEADQPVRAQRWMEANPFDEPELDLDGALRNSQMSEHPSSPSGVFVVRDMIAKVRRERLFPVCWATGQPQENLLDLWLGVNAVLSVAGGEELFGIPLHRLQVLPEDTLVLCAATFRDADIKDIKTTIKTAIELMGDVNGNASCQTAHPSGPDPRERGGAAQEMEAAEAGNGTSAWAPGRYLRARMGLGGGLREGASTPDPRRKPHHS